MASAPFVSFPMSCSSVVCVSHSLSQHALGDVAVLSMLLTITGRRVLLRDAGLGVFPLENVAARICREAGGRVRTNVYVWDMDLGVVNQFDIWRFDVVVDGLPLFQGAQLAVNTTVVFPLTREGAAKPRSAVVSGVCLQVARRRKETLPRACFGCIRGRGRTLLAVAKLPRVVAGTRCWLVLQRVLSRSPLSTGAFLQGGWSYAFHTRGGGRFSPLLVNR